MGLEVTNKIIKAMGGKLSIDSKVGQGTTCTLEVPMKAREASLLSSTVRNNIAITIRLYLLKSAN